jgi:NhaP-type Na+/H+ or K+/H+ antiporter
MFQKSTKTMVKEAVVQNGVGMVMGLGLMIVTLVGFGIASKKIINSMPKEDSEKSES